MTRINNKWLGLLAVAAMLSGTRQLTAEAKTPDEGGVKSVTFDDVKLELKKGDPYDASLLTPAIKNLDGKQIRIRGYILPGFQQSGITNFVLVRDNMECCFG